MSEIEDKVKDIAEQRKDTEKELANERGKALDKLEAARYGCCMLAVQRVLTADADRIAIHRLRHPPSRRAVRRAPVN